MPATPLCPALLAAKATIAIPESDGRWFEYTDPTTEPGVECIGSRCVKWVPETRAVTDPNSLAYTERTGNGHCVDNPHNIFADPATPTPKSAE